MEKEYILHTAETIRHQLVTLTPTNVLLSWGIESLAATLIQDMAALKLKVNGRIHQGSVYIAYNEGVDYYEIFLGTAAGTRRIAEDVDFEQLGDVIDRHIESGDNPSEYDAFCESERQKLMRGDFS